MTELAVTRGSGFVLARTFVLDRFGANGFGPVLERLTPADRWEVTNVLPIGWYALPLYCRVLRAIDLVHGCGDNALLVQFGRFAADHEFGPSHRQHLRTHGLGAVAERLPEIWKRRFDGGEWAATAVSDGHIDATLTALGHVDHALCREFSGYLGRVLELGGARFAWVEHPRCRAYGANECAFTARWIGRSVGSEAPDGGPVSAPSSLARPGVVIDDNAPLSAPASVTFAAGTLTLGRGFTVSSAPASVSDAPPASVSVSPSVAPSGAPGPVSGPTGAPASRDFPTGHGEPSPSAEGKRRA